MTRYHSEYKRYTSEYAPSFSTNYLLSLPEDYEVGETLPMIVFLHGAGEVGTTPASLQATGLMRLIKDGLPVRAVVLAPHLPNRRRVWNNLVDEIFELIDKTANELNVDKNRISITGLSMGGYGTWEMGICYRDYFSAMAPVCGGGLSWRAPDLVGMPIRTFHGDVDGTVPISVTYEMVNRINAAGGNVSFTILHNVSHNCWDYAYGETNLLEWLVAQDKSKR